MPYVTQERRAQLHNGEQSRVPGDLNFRFSMMILHGTFQKHQWQPMFYAMMQDYIASQGLCYQAINDVMGAAWCCERELGMRFNGDYVFGRQHLLLAADRFYKEVARPYEDTKIEANGDIL